MKEEVRGERGGKVIVVNVGEITWDVLCDVKDELQIDGGSNDKGEWS